MSRARRALTLLAATAGALWLISAPAGALTLTIPTIPVPVLPPIQLPVSASVTGGTGGSPIDVTVKAPGSTSVDVQLPLLPTVTTVPTLPTVPSLPVTPVTVPVGTPAPTVTVPIDGAPSGSAQPTPGAGSIVTIGSPKTAGATPGAAAPASPAGPSTISSTPGAVTAAISGHAPGTFLSSLPSVAARVLLWVALVGAALALRWSVISALRSRRAQPSPIS